jgi:hypothetical protein
MTKIRFKGSDIMKDPLRLTAEKWSDKFKLQLCNLQAPKQFLNTWGEISGDRFNFLFKER